MLTEHYPDLYVILKKGIFAINNYMLVLEAKKEVDVLMKNGADPFYPIHDDLYEPIPTLHHLIKDRVFTFHLEFLEQLDQYHINWNYTDSWGQNLLHYTHPLNCELWNTLIELGTDPNQKATIDNIEKVTLAKIKGTLPKKYNKTPLEYLKENYPNCLEGVEIERTKSK